MQDGKKKDFSTLPLFHRKRPSWNEESDDSDDDEIEIIKKSGLSRLELSGNQFTDIPVGLPCLAPNLARLHMSKNKITVVSSLSCLPEHLMALDLSDNNMKSFNVMAGKEDNIVNNMCYAVVRRSSFIASGSYSQGKKRTCQHRKHKQMMDLNRLTLSNNCLESIQVMTSIPSSSNPEKERICIYFPELKMLDVSNNKLGKVPSGIGKLKNLQSLTLSDNSSMESLPSELGLCSGLFELKIKNLKLKDPPKNVIDKQSYDGRIDVKGLTGYLKSLHDK